MSTTLIILISIIFLQLAIILLLLILYRKNKKSLNKNKKSLNICRKNTFKIKTKYTETIDIWKRVSDFYRYGLAKPEVISQQHGNGNGKKYLFVSGMARSGTSALGMMLNLSTDIAMFIELYSPWKPYAPELFEKDKIIDGLQSRRHVKLNKEILEKSINCTYIGDKMPMLFVQLKELLQNFQNNDIRIIHIFRNIEDIALSHYKRAMDKNDSWPEKHETNSAVVEFNKMCQFFAEYDLHKDPRFIFVDYDKFFSNSEMPLSLFNKIGTSDASSELLKNNIDDFLMHSQKITSRTRSLEEIPNFQPEEFYSRIDLLSALKVEKKYGVNLIKETSFKYNAHSIYKNTLSGVTD